MTVSAPSPTGPSRALARFSSGLTFDAVPGATVERLKLCLLDGLSCAIHATGLPWSRMLTAFAHGDGRRRRGRGVGNAVQGSGGQRRAGERHAGAQFRARRPAQGIDSAPELDRGAGGAGHGRTAGLPDRARSAHGVGGGLRGGYPGRLEPGNQPSRRRLSPPPAPTARSRPRRRRGACWSCRRARWSTRSASRRPRRPA